MVAPLLRRIVELDGHPCGKRQASPTTWIIPHDTGDQLPDAEITSPNNFQAVPSNFATRVNKKVCGESDEVAAAPPCVATAIARWRLRRKGISKQGGTCHGRRSG